ncbi:DNA binding protein [Haplosporangium sp. Z 767]|nr:DNA binding protein [Haplosporangium sp. Z 11]KAF9177101.1 DNA binding protein [Haplosporangium sp. Z 767]
MPRRVSQVLQIIADTNLSQLHTCTPSSTLTNALLHQLFPTPFLKLTPKSAAATKSLTQQQSLAITKKLIRTSLGSIAYLRSFFPEESFEDSREGDVRVKVLKKGHSVEADRVIQWFEGGIYDALEKQYLKTIVFGVYLDPDQPEELVERYTFHLAYGQGHVSLQLETSDVKSNSTSIVTADTLAGLPVLTELPLESNALTESTRGQERSSTKTTSPLLPVREHERKPMNVIDIKRTLEAMIRQLIMYTQTLQALPANKHLTVRLFYYDYTPDDYEPPFFTEASDDPKDQLRLESESMSLRIGKLDTTYHSLHMLIEAVERDLIEAKSIPIWIPDSPSVHGPAEIDQAFAHIDLDHGSSQPETLTLPTQVLDDVEYLPERDDGPGLSPGLSDRPYSCYSLDPMHRNSSWNQLQHHEEGAHQADIHKGNVPLTIANSWISTILSSPPPTPTESKVIRKASSRPKVSKPLDKDADRASSVCHNMETRSKRRKCSKEQQGVNVHVT